MLANIRIVSIKAMNIFHSPRNKNHAGKTGNNVTKGMASHAKPDFTAFNSFEGC